MSRWLAEVVAKGTGKKARLARYAAAGKTGTAQVPGEHGGYKTGAYTASFAGFFPAERPEYVVLVMFGEPRGKYYGGDVAAPVFKAVADRISYMQTAGTTP
jgi:cell division protein FtsI/penicillin-binding protein 2